MDTVVNVGDSLFDVAVREFGHVQGVYDLIKANGIGVSDDLPAGTALQVEDPAKYQEQKPADAGAISKDLLPSASIEPGQNIFDIAIAFGGHIEAVRELVKDNGLSFSSLVSAGSTLAVRKQPKNKLVADFFSNKQPATGSAILVGGKAPLEGIDYWAVNKDFIVQ